MKSLILLSLISVGLNAHALTSGYNANGDDVIFTSWCEKDVLVLPHDGGEQRKD